MYRFFGSAGAALIAVSIIISFLVLPLYLRADTIQEEEQGKQRSMERWKKHISSTFRGEERQMMLSAYYRSEGYRPLYALRGTLSLLLQIPFFLAAYHYLSHLEALQGRSFGPISDLGAADTLLRLGGLHVHLLPILMTVFNCISGAIYTKGQPAKQKLQLYAIALVFLILLYNSPSGLVVYWTMNNLFSLCKNAVMKYVKDKPRFLAGLSAVCGVVFVCYVIFGGRVRNMYELKDMEGLCLYAVIAMLLVLPLLRRTWSSCSSLNKREADLSSAASTGSVGFTIVLLIECALAVLTGMLIPMSVISSSPLELVNPYFYLSPLHFMLTSLCTAAGLFIVWGSVIYYIAGERGRGIYARVLFSLFFVFIFDYIFLNPDVGSYSIFLVFERVPHYSRGGKLLNLLVIFALIAGTQLLWRADKRKSAAGSRSFSWTGSVMIVLLMAMCVMSARQIILTQKALSTVVADGSYEEEDVRVPLSRTGSNVVVIMLDRGIGAYVPFIFNELPELKEKYAGFTFYPNTVSMGKYTNSGSPALFGGYDYTPAAINVRADESLAKKHNEALKLMPLLFGEAGYTVTVSDLPYTGYSEIADFSIYDDCPYVNAFHFEDRMDSGYTADERRQRMERSFYFHSMYKIAPAMLQDNIYDYGRYLTMDEDRMAYFMESFRVAYAALKKLPEISEMIDEGDTLFLYDNNITHEPVTLALPDYTLDDTSHNDDYDWLADKELNGVVMSAGNDGTVGIAHYHANVAALKMIAEWLDFLRKEGVYDNTRIIIASDHGRALNQFSNMLLDGVIDVQVVNPILMLKDFNSIGFNVDERFMTNGDVPSLALQGLIQDPVNPFTGNAVDESGKENGVLVFWGDEQSLLPGNVFQPEDAPWYHVQGDILDARNWEKVR